VRGSVFHAAVRPLTLFDWASSSALWHLGLVLYADRLGELLQGWLERHVRWQPLRKGIGVLTDVVFTTLAVEFTLTPSCSPAFTSSRWCRC